MTTVRPHRIGQPELTRASRCAVIFCPDGSSAPGVTRMAEGGCSFGKPAAKSAAAP